MNATLDGRERMNSQFDMRIAHAIRENAFSSEKGTQSDLAMQVMSMRQFLADAHYVPYADKLSDDALGSAHTLMVRVFQEVREAIYLPEDRVSDAEAYLSEMMPQVIRAANEIHVSENGHPEPDSRCLFRFLENIGLSDITSALSTETLGWALVLLRNIRKDLGITR